MIFQVVKKQSFDILITLTRTNKYDIRKNSTEIQQVMLDGAIQQFLSSGTIFITISTLAIEETKELQIF